MTVFTVIVGFLSYNLCVSIIAFQFVVAMKFMYNNVTQLLCFAEYGGEGCPVEEEGVHPNNYIEHFSTVNIKN